MRRTLQQFASWLLAAVVIFSLPASTFAQGGGNFKATPLSPTSVTSVTAAKGTAANNGLVSVIVKLNDASLSAYRGGTAGLAATSPSATGATRLDVKSAASQAYLAYLAGQHNAFTAAAKQAVPSARVVHDYKIVINGVSLILPAKSVAALRKLPGVAAIYQDRLAQVDTDHSPQFIGAPHIWDELGGAESSGDGVIVGVIDTGIWPEHASFSDPDPDGKAYTTPAGWAGTRCDFGNTAWNQNDAPFTCNNKLLGAAEFLDTYKAFTGLTSAEFDSARDSEGHGTHTSSTAAGNHDVAATLLGVSRGNVSGIAPRASVAMYRSCAALGCYTSDSSAAIEQAIADGVNVINYSISGGSDPYSDVVSLAFLDAYDAGVFVAASAGNSGPGLDTTDHREPWVTTVGASTQARAFVSTLTVTGSNGDSLSFAGASVTAGISTATAVVSAADYGDAFCLNDFPAGTFSGQIVICERGTNARVDKGYHVLQGGAGGMILYNQSTAVTDEETDNHWLPAVHIQFTEGSAILGFLTSHTGVTATFTAGTANKGQGDVMASFSSRGGPGQTLGVSKPDVTAPGVQILAGMTPFPDSITGGPPGQLFQAIAGTSMSSPHVAGSGALLKALHPTWTPGQIHSALMTSAKTDGVVKEDGATPTDPFDDGSGRIDLRFAGEPGLTFDATGQDYLDHQGDLFDTNYPSIYIPRMPGRITVQRTAHSVLATKANWKFSVQSPSDVHILVPNGFKIDAGGDATFDITIDASTVPQGETRFSTIILRSGNMSVHIPVTIVRGQPDVTLSKTCDPATLGVGGTTGCTITAQNNSLSPATVSLKDLLPSQLQLVAGSVTGGQAKGNGVSYNATLAAQQPPTVNVVDGTGTTFGYLPLSLFGVQPLSGAGDETIFNFSVAPFVYAGVSYSSIDMTSDGYAVAGGTGDGADLDFINQSFPDPTRPNNVLAPFWSDLNPGTGGGMYAAVLTDGVNNWLVLDWENVPNFGTSDVNSFEVWVGQNGTEDIFYNFGDVTQGTGGALTVGAENDTGTSGANWWFNGAGTPVVNGSEVRVSSVPGAAGETHVITFDATGASAGAWTNCAQMTADIFFGTSVACFSGTVTP